MSDRKRILIVDDEGRVAYFLRKTLERMDRRFQVETVPSGEEALLLFQEGAVDLLITDLRMPGINGLELIERVRQISPTTPVILITAYGSDEIEARARRLQIYRYLTKPFDINEFTDAVIQALSDRPIREPGILVLPDRHFRRLVAALEDLSRRTEAFFALLINAAGQRIAAVGDSSGIDTETLSSLLGGSFASFLTLGGLFDDSAGLNFLYREGQQVNLYAVNVAEEMVLALLLDRRVSRVPVGVVWLEMKRAVEHLLEIVPNGGWGEPAAALDEAFSSAVSEHLDQVLAERSAPPSTTPPLGPEVQEDGETNLVGLN